MYYSLTIPGIQQQLYNTHWKKQAANFKICFPLDTGALPGVYRQFPDGVCQAVPVSTAAVPYRSERVRRREVRVHYSTTNTPSLPVNNVLLIVLHPTRKNRRMCGYYEGRQAAFTPKLSEEVQTHRRFLSSRKYKCAWPIAAFIYKSVLVRVKACLTLCTEVSSGAWLLQYNAGALTKSVPRNMKKKSRWRWTW